MIEGEHLCIPRGFVLLGVANLLSRGYYCCIYTGHPLSAAEERAE